MSGKGSTDESKHVKEVSVERMKRSWRSLAIGGAVFALFAVGVGLAGAQRGQDGPPPGPGVNRPDGERAGLRDEFASKLAAKLGISVDTLRSAMQSTREEMRPQAEARMQQMRERMHERVQEFRGQRDGDESGPRRQDGMRRPSGGPGMGPMGPAEGFRPGERSGGAPGIAMAGPMQMMNGVAEILGMQPEDLHNELRQGKSLSQIAQEHGQSPDALADQIVSRVQQTNAQMLREMIRRMMDHTMPVPSGSASNGSAL